MKAMLLAAGRGERLRPLTDSTPKPLIAVGAHRLIEYNIFKLKQAGVTDIVINVCYLAQQIVRYLGNGSRYGVNIEYSFEGDDLLDTGGGIQRALTLLGEKPFWLVSADIWSDYSFQSLELSGEIHAHLIMVENPSYHPRGDFGILADGKLTLESPRHTYGNIAVLKPELFYNCESAKFPLSLILKRGITNGSISGELYSGKWFNIGTLEELSLLQKSLL